MPRRQAASAIRGLTARFAGVAVPDGSLHGKTIVVTGGTGFIGSAFVRHAVGVGARVSVIARAGSDHWRLANVTGQYSTLTSTLTGLGNIDPVSNVDVFIHFAAAGVNQSFDDVGELVSTNVEGTVHALQFAHRSGARRFVQLGSSGEYGAGVAITEGAPLRPTSEYGATRAAATLVARAFGQRRGLDVVVVRPFAVYGPYEAAYRLIPYCILRGLRGKPINISSGVQTRDYLHVDDVARGIALACAIDAARGGIFNLCSGMETTVLEAATLVARLSGSASEVAAGERTPIPGEMWRTSGNAEHARATLGWTVTREVPSGLEQTIEWFRSEGLALAAYRETA